MKKKSLTIQLLEKTEAYNKKDIEGLNLKGENERFKKELEEYRESLIRTLKALNDTNEALTLYRTWKIKELENINLL